MSTPLTRRVQHLRAGDTVTASIHITGDAPYTLTGVLVDGLGGGLAVDQGKGSTWELVREASGQAPGYLREVVQQIVSPGLYDGIPEREYHAGVNTPLPSLSNSSMADLLGQSTPAHFRWNRTHPRGDGRVFDVGRAAHARVLGVGEEMAACPADRLSVDGKMTTAKAKAWALEQRAAGIVPLRPDDYIAVRDMADALAEHPTAGALLTSPSMRPEVSAYAQDPVTGVWIRGRFDVLDDLLADYKTARCAHPDAFAKSALSYGYHRQAWLYRHLHEWATGDTLPDPLLFVVQEKTPPYLVSLVRLDDEFDRLAAGQVRQAIDLFAACQAADEWPGYSPDVVTISPPSWTSRLLDDMASDEDDDPDSELLDDLERIFSS